MDDKLEIKLQHQQYLTYDKTFDAELSHELFHSFAQSIQQYIWLSISCFKTNEKLRKIGYENDFCYFVAKCHEEQHQES